MKFFLQYNNHITVISSKKRNGQLISYVSTHKGFSCSLPVMGVMED